MFNSLRNNSLTALVVGLLLGVPLIGSGQNTINEIKQRAKATKLSPDLLNLQLEVAQQNQRGNLRQAAPQTNGSNSQKTNQTGLRYDKLLSDNRINSTKVGPLKDINQRAGSLRQAALSKDGIKSMKLSMMQVRDGMVAIEAISNDIDGQILLNNLQALGIKDGRYYQRIVFGYFPIDKLSLLGNVPSLRFVRPALRPIRNAGKVTSQGDVSMRSDIARQTYNVTGAGSKIGILSDSYNALGGAEDGVASGDLPPGVQILKDPTLQDDSLLSDEGRGMAEIVHDIAPGAALAFHTAFESYVDFALGIKRLANAGCNIIVDDVSYGNEPFFQDGIIAQAVDYVNKNQGVSYFSSAGNDARNSYTSGFHNSGKLPPLPDGFAIPGSAAHDFGNGKITQKITIDPGSRFLCILQWSDPFYSESIASGGVSGAKTDIDLLVYQNGELVNGSIDPNIGNDPIEFVLLTNPTDLPIEYELVILKFEGPDPALIKWINLSNGDAGTHVEFDTKSSTLVGHSNAKGAIAVGAAPWFFYPPSLTWYRSPLDMSPYKLVEEYSSAGGTPILFTTYGQPIPSETRLKPEIVAPDGGSTTFFGFKILDGDDFPNFFGTSAAAPHAAAVAALLQEKAHNTMSPADVLLRLRTTAIDMDDPLTPGFDTGFDFQTGFGFIQADKALMFGQPLTILEPLYDCETGKITLLTSGGDGSPITFTAPGVTRTPPTSTTILSGAYWGPPLVYTLYTPTSTTGIVEAELRNDPKNIVITAMQSGVKVVYDFNFDAYCHGQNSQSRVAATEPGTGLQIKTLGNPIATDWVEVEVRGVKGQPVKLQVNNTLGGVNSSQAVDRAELVERHKLMLGHSPGLYFLQVSTPTETKTLKVIRQ